MKTKNIPFWILIVSGIFALMELMVGIALFAIPDEMLEKVDFSAQGSYFLVQSWAVRQFALGVVFSYAIYEKSSTYLKAAYLFMLIMFLGDIAVGFAQNENQAMVAGAMMSVVSAIMIYFLNKEK